MTDTTLIWIGILGQGIPLITGVYLVTVGNWCEKRMDKWMETDIPDDQLYECEM